MTERSNVARPREEAVQGFFDRLLIAALPKNTQRRNEQAVQRKLDAIADGFLDLEEHFSTDNPGPAAKKKTWRAA